MGEDDATLRHIGQSLLQSLIGPNPRNLFAPKPDLPPPYPAEPNNGFENGRFAGPVGADNSYDLTLMDVERDLIQDLVVPVAGREALNLEDGFSAVQSTPQ